MAGRTHARGPWRPGTAASRQTRARADHPLNRRGRAPWLQLSRVRKPRPPPRVTDHEHRCERMSAPTSPERLSLPSRPRRRRCDPHRGNGPTGHCCVNTDCCASLPESVRHTRYRSAFCFVLFDSLLRAAGAARRIAARATQSHREKSSRASRAHPRDDSRDPRVPSCTL